jgi:sec-independent protein translocase protein TatB
MSPVSSLTANCRSLAFELSERCATFSRVFGFSFGELLVICVVALIAVGPKKLPGMLQTLGQWLRKIRNLTVEVRNQTGIDELLRSEGLNGGLNELRGLLRGNHGIGFEPAPQPTPRAPIEDPYANVDIDVSREYPQEGADSYGVLPDDLLEDEAPKPASAASAVSATDPVQPV